MKAVSQLLLDNDIKSMIVFCNTKRNVDKIVQDLHYEGVASGKIHGDLTQRMRTDVMDKFRRGKIKILVATDVAARGIDIKDIDAVLNFDIPFDPENYVHRIGRTGRAGTTGNAYSIVTGRNEKEKLRMYERMTKVTINPFQVNIPGVETLEIKEGRGGYNESSDKGGRYNRSGSGGGNNRRSEGGGGYHGRNNSGNRRSSGGGYGNNGNSYDSSSNAGGNNFGKNRYFESPSHGSNEGRSFNNNRSERNASSNSGRSYGGNNNRSEVGSRPRRRRTN